MRLSTKDLWEPPEVGRHRISLSLRISGKNQPFQHLGLALLPPELWENGFLLFKGSVCGTLLHSPRTLVRQCFQALSVH